MDYNQLRAATEHYRDTGPHAFFALRRFSASCTPPGERVGTDVRQWSRKALWKFLTERFGDVFPMHGLPDRDWDPRQQALADAVLHINQADRDTNLAWLEHIGTQLHKVVGNSPRRHEPVLLASFLVRRGATVPGEGPLRGFIAAAARREERHGPPTGRKGREISALVSTLHRPRGPAARTRAAPGMKGPGVDPIIRDAARITMTQGALRAAGPGHLRNGAPLGDDPGMSTVISNSDIQTHGVGRTTPRTKTQATKAESQALNRIALPPGAAKRRDGLGRERRPRQIKAGQICAYPPCRALVLSQ